MDEDRVVDIVLGIVVITVLLLKITNVITVSWWIILSPVLLCLAIGTAFAIFFLVAFMISLWRNR